MAKLYGKLRGLSQIRENKPKVGITKQTWSDTTFIIRGKDDGVPAWHFILVPIEKIHIIKKVPMGGSLDCTLCGSIMKYKDEQDQIMPMSGWGRDPPQSLKSWFYEHYDSGSVDENTILEYKCDDIRLCTMQRITSHQLIGIFRCFNKQYQFHYIRLSENYQITLAYRSGIRKFDRFISLNGVNIEQETVEQIAQRFKTQLHLPVQILVCSPATYHYYKSNNLIIHSDLPTVQHLKPVFDISLSDGEACTSNIPLNDNFCVVQLEDNNEICVVPQASVFKSPDFTNINDICFVEIEGKYKRGKIRFKGSKNECEHFENDEYTFDGESISSDEIILNKTSRFEDLSNELLFYLFNYLTLEDFHNAFFDVNNRLNNVLFSCYNLSLRFNEKTDPLLIKFYGCKIDHLIIDGSNQCHLNQFNNLKSLILFNRNLTNINQIRPEIVPNLGNLSFLLKFDFKPPVELVNQIFSNRFPYIRKVNLGHIDKCMTKSWLKSPSLRIVSIRCDEAMIIENILRSCPNLHHLQVHLLNNYDIGIVCDSSSAHRLKRFTLWSEELELPIDLIDRILSSIPNVERLYIQTRIRVSFIEFIHKIIYRLKNLNRFDCFIKELIRKDDRIENLNDINKIYSCFNRIQCIKQNEHFTIFATE